MAQGYAHSTRARGAPAAPAEAEVAETDAIFRLGSLVGNSAMQELASDEAFTQATAGRDAGVPYRSEMEASFGQDFSGVHAWFDQGEALAPIGAKAAAAGESVAFGEATPDRETVAHELTHVVQQRGGGASVQADSGLSAPGSAPEREARAVAPQVAAGESVQVGGPQRDKAPGVLPEGTLTASDLESWFKAFRAQGGGGVSTIFAALADGKSRTLPGGVVRALFEKNGLDLSGILPMEALVKVVSDGKSAAFHFDFGNKKANRKGKVVTVPSSKTWVLKNGKPKLIEGDSQKMKVQKIVRFAIGPDGITGLGKGDIQPDGGWVGFVNIDMEMQQHQGKAAELEDNPILVTDESGQPVKKDGKYVTQTYDEWIKITGPLGITRDIGLPKIPGA